MISPPLLHPEAFAHRRREWVKPGEFNTPARELNMTQLDGKTASGSSVAVPELARPLPSASAAAGCHVAISGRREAVLVEAAAEHDGTPTIVHKVADAADRPSVTDLITWANEALGRVDILVNSAGINVADRSLERLDPQDWDRLIAVNATGAYNCVWAVLPQMRSRRDGVIINVSSIAGKRATMLGGVAYNASKFAMAALGTSAALEVGGEGIRVTTIFPGEVENPDPAPATGTGQCRTSRANPTTRRRRRRGPDDRLPAISGPRARASDQTNVARLRLMEHVRERVNHSRHVTVSTSR